MRIEAIKVERFGRLTDFDVGTPALPALVVVLGPNEAGKSTLFQFLTTVLYGFHPASREGNPYAPWDGNDASGIMNLRLDAGRSVDVERRLRSSPTGRLVMDGRTEDLRNRPVPWVEHVPRTVFRQVFAVTLAELTGLDEETWARVQDRILGSMGSTDLVPARRVAADLEQEAGELWRPSRRGNQRIRDVQEAILSLRDRRREAAERDLELRSMVSELETTRERLQEARVERHQERLVIERVQALTPVRAQLRRIDALMEDAGPADELEGLPADPGAALADASARVAALEERLREAEVDMAEPRASVVAFGEADAQLLEHAEEIKVFVARSAGSGADRSRLRAIEEESRDVERRLEGMAGQIFAVPWARVPTGPIVSISTPDLHARIEAFRSAREERRVLEMALRRRAPAGEPATPSSAPLAGSLATLLAGGVLLVVGLANGGLLITAFGAVLIGVGIALMLAWRRARRALEKARAPADDGADGLRVLREAEEAARGAVLLLLRDVPVLPSLLEEPGSSLVTGLEGIQNHLRDRDARMREAAEVDRRVTEVDVAARTMAKLLGLGDGSDAESTGHVLERELRRAERLREASATAARELRRLEREAARLKRDLTDARSAMDRLHSRLAEAGEGDAERGATTLRDRLEALARARQLHDELERAHPDLEEIRERIATSEAAGESWTVDVEDLARRQAHHEELVDEAESLTRRAEALEQGIARLREMETVDSVDGEAAALKEEEAALVARRDRLWVLAQLVREADRRFREEHQPDLMRRAGAYLARLTGGRYDRIVADETGDGDVFFILGPDLPGPVALRTPVSTGTLEQSYLSLRLAMVDHLDQGTERLPLFVDEVFVNWDGERRARGLDLLADIAETRQLFVFTCHPEVAEELRARGAGLLSLPWP
ncbi:MAG: AAA family ATPase [Gemmatimonadetes bacterium]|nr:AAA family ATPase [Gemmatimonadota bacterium]